MSVAVAKFIYMRHAKVWRVMKYFRNSVTRCRASALSPLILTVALVALVATAAGCSSPNDAGQFDSEVPVAWFELMNLVVEDSKGYSPPVASRVFGYAGVALYEAVAPGITNGQSIASQLNGLSGVPQVDPDAEYHWPTVANSALRGISTRMFPEASLGFQTSMQQLDESFQRRFRDDADEQVIARSAAHGGAVAEAVYAWSINDGGSEVYLDNFPTYYVPPVGPEFWVPTPRQKDRGWWKPPLRGLTPSWGDNRPFVLTEEDFCAAPPPLEYSEEVGSLFYQEAMEVYDTVKNLTPEQRDIALFWSDDPSDTSTPPGHSISILNQIVLQKGVTLDVAAEAYAKVGIALADAFITCWRDKYKYNLIRPITYIQRHIDETWNVVEANDPVETPPFPEYTSGHSVQAAAAAEVMTDMFGQVAFIDYTRDDLGYSPRSFDSIFAYAEEAAISRLYGGIHYRAAIDDGLVQGKCVARKVNALKFITGG